MQPCFLSHIRICVLAGRKKLKNLNSDMWFTLETKSFLIDSACHKFLECAKLFYNLWFRTFVSKIYPFSFKKLNCELSKINPYRDNLSTRKFYVMSYSIAWSNKWWTHVLTTNLEVCCFRVEVAIMFSYLNNIICDFLQKASRKKKWKRKTHLTKNY